MDCFCNCSRTSDEGADVGADEGVHAALFSPNAGIKNLFREFCDEESFLSSVEQSVGSASKMYKRNACSSKVGEMVSN